MNIWCVCWEINQDERQKIREEERRKIMKEMKREKQASYSSHDSCKSLSEELSNYLLAIIQVRKGRFL